MNVNAQYTVVKQKANYERICDLEEMHNPFSPCEDNGQLFLGTSSGYIITFNEGGNFETYFNLEGASITSVVFENNQSGSAFSNCYYSDTANPGIYYLYSVGNEKKSLTLVTDYEGQPLIGPNSIALSSEENCLYFTDAGDPNLEQLEIETSFPTSFNQPRGSLFRIDLETKILKPILYKCLSFPSFVLHDPDNKTIFVADTYSNQVIKLTQKPYGVFNPSVFHQFSGRLGPSALAKDGNYLYVSRFDYQRNLGDFVTLEDELLNGVISVINRDGNLVGELILPGMPEITGMMISPKKKDLLYLTEKNNNGVIKIKLASFNIDLDKVDKDNNSYK